MRPITLFIVALAVAAPALAAPGKPRIVVPSAPAAARLRGPIAAGPTTSQGPAAPSAVAQQLFLPPAIATPAATVAPQECRLACAQTYYFCASTESPDECPARWALCRAGCDAPAPAQSVAPR